MRLIGTIENGEKGKQFSAYLTQIGILNQCDLNPNTDWSSPNYSDISSTIWVQEEDKTEEALNLFQSFIENPEDPKFAIKPLETSSDPTSFKMTEAHAKLIRMTANLKDQQKKILKLKNKEIPFKRESSNPKLGMITLYLMALCIFLFIWGSLTAPQIERIPAAFPTTPIFSPPINKILLYDYPETFEIIDRLVFLYGVEDIMHPVELPEEGKYLFHQYLKTPYWQGYYEIVAREITTPSLGASQPIPMFEKIQKGEIWRLFTPCLLHANIIHILFNMLWLIILSRQMEDKLGSFRLLLFILITGIFSNTLQYLAGGSNFLGISGVLCAMLGFIWMRQKKTPWERYELQAGTVSFMAIFVFAMATLQLLSFATETKYNISLSPGMANTAHISGGAIGAFLGMFKIFKSR